MTKKVEEKQPNITVVVELQEDGNLNVEGNIAPLASLHLLNRASQLLIEKIATPEEEPTEEVKPN